MNRPYQTKKPYECDNEDRLSATEEAMGSVIIAMEALRGLWEYDHIFEALGEAYDMLEEENRVCENIAAAEYRKEIEGLTRDYYRMVM